MNAEERGEIPTAQRVQRGRTQVRAWTAEQLPGIGARFGYLSPLQQQEILCIYTAKGGVLKTTLSYCLARLLALHGIKTLIVGLDIQGSITDLALPNEDVETLEEYQGIRRKGLYHLLYQEAPKHEIIRETDIPTLSVIPETIELSLLEKRLHLETRREYVFRDRLLEQLKDYAVIIFDNGPNWMQLTQNALVAATTVISPLGCDLGTFQALEVNLGNISDFQKTMKLIWRNFLVVPTLLEKTKISQQIYASYISQCATEIISTPIRRAVAGQEALVFSQTPIEHDPKSALAQDYTDMAKEVWKRILEAQMRLRTHVA